jgi:archaetidylinositol phosphate synthase
MLDTILGSSHTVKSVRSAAASGLYKIGVTADRATIGAAALGVIAGLAFALEYIGFGLAMLVLSALLDGLDGTIAREHSGTTPFGGVLDLSFDRVVEAAVILGIAIRRPDLYLPGLVLVATWYVNITVFLAVGAALDRSGPKLIAYPPGLLERTEAIIFLVLLALSGPFGPALCYTLAILEIYTAAQRFRFGLEHLSNPNPSAV